MKIETAVFEASYGLSSQLPESNVPEIVFSGRSNVGKSSLLNKILNRKSLARVSAVPGKTITINFFKLDDCRFVDLPGYGYAKRTESERKRWSEAIEGYFSSGRNIKLIVQLIDMRHPPSDDDMTMIEYMESVGIPYIIALTKSDKLNKTGHRDRLASLKDELLSGGTVKLIPFSIMSGEGVSEIKQAIRNIVK